MHKCWVYFEILRGCYGLSQSEILSSKQLILRLKKEGYYEARITPGLWRHKWIPIQNCVILDDFGVEYVGKQHAYHLPTILKKITISQKIGRAKNAGIDCNGTMKKEHVEQLWMDTSWNSETNIDIWQLNNHNNHRTNTKQLIMVLHSK